MHIYKKDDTDYISVTTLVGLMYPFDKAGFRAWAKVAKIDPDWILAESSRIGTKVHRWCENRVWDIQHLFDEKPRDDKEQRYLVAVDKFFGQFPKVLLVDSEKMVFDNEYNFAGTVDMVSKTDIYDFKTWGAWKGSYKRDPKKIKKVRVQLSMYRHALGNKHGMKVVVFKPDGTYEEETLSPDNTWKAWIKSNQDKIKAKLNEGLKENSDGSGTIIEAR